MHEDLNFFLAATRDRPRWFDPASTDPALKVLAVLTGIPNDYVLVQESRVEGIVGLDEPVFLARSETSQSRDGPVEINPENRMTPLTGTSCSWTGLSDSSTCSGRPRRKE